MGLLDGVGMWMEPAAAAGGGGGGIIEAGGGSEVEELVEDCIAVGIEPLGGLLSQGWCRVGGNRSSG